MRRKRAAQAFVRSFTQRRGSNTNPPLTPSTSTTTPEHFDVAPEVNIRLARDLSRLGSVCSFIGAAAAAVRRGPTATKVLVSFNREMMGSYGRGTYFPFGRVVMPRKSEQAELLAVFVDVDEVLLTNCPHSPLLSPPRGPVTTSWRSSRSSIRSRC